MSKYELIYNANHWECGDGCCDGTEYQILINNNEIGWYSDLSRDNFDALDRFINVLNKGVEDYKLVYSAELDKDGDLDDVIYLNSIKITNSLWECDMFEDILEKLKLQHEIIVYDLDWDIWKNEKRLVLVLENS